MQGRTPSCAVGVFELQAAEQQQTCGELSAPHPKGLEESTYTLVMVPQPECSSTGWSSGPERVHTDAQPSSTLHSPRVCLPRIARCFQKLQVFSSVVLLLSNALLSTKMLRKPESQPPFQSLIAGLLSVCVPFSHSSPVLLSVRVRRLLKRFCWFSWVDLPSINRVCKTLAKNLGGLKKIYFLLPYEGLQADLTCR